jgi:hypothetical protein
MKRISGSLWLLALIGATIFALFVPTWDHPVLVPVLIALWIITLVGIIRPPALRSVYRALAAPFHALRRVPALYWVAVLVYITFFIGWWTVHFQPTNGRYLQPFEFAYLLLVLWGLIALFQFDGSREEARAMGVNLEKNPLTGVLITLTTLWVLVIAAEAYLRIFYITTDAYTYTAMNYHWYQNFYYPSFNSLGYRDHEPNPDAPRRIAVVGDSFTVGQGINDIDDTFPQLIEQGLNDGTDVNVVAQSGWDTDVQEYHLDLYPYQPDTVILAYYLNDIDYIIVDTDRDPNRNFTFPDPGFGSWFVLNFFVPNFIYYNLIQITSPQRNTSFMDDLVSVYDDAAIWDRQVMQLDSLVAWTQRNNVRLIVLLFPNPIAIEASAPVLLKVGDYFRQQDIEVIDLSEPLREFPPTSLIVNNFDTHPSILAHEVAAREILRLLSAQQAGN